MYLKNLFTTIKDADIRNIDIDSLYLLSKASLLSLWALGFLVVIALYENQKVFMILWYLMLSIIIFIRLFDTKNFIGNFQKYSLKQWHDRFFILSILSAVMFSLLGIFLFDTATLPEKYFIMLILLGLSSASVSALAASIRLNMLYTSILLVPISIMVLFSNTLPLHTVITSSYLLYFISQIFIINISYIRKQKISNLESDEKIFHSLLRNAPVGVFTYNDELEILDCNDELSAIFDNRKENIIGINLTQLPDKRPLKVFQTPLSLEKDTYTGPYKSINGKDLWLEAKAFMVDKGNGRGSTGVGIVENKTKEHNALIKLEYLVHHDTLTELYNRRGLLDAMEKITTDSRHLSYYSLLFYLDLNQFKAINDSLGHNIGDKILIAVSKRLSDTLLPNAIISRLGGDEYVFIIPYISNNKNEAREKATKLSKVIENTFLDPFIIDEMHLYMSASMGIVVIQPKYKNITELLRQGDLTMYQAKKSNKSIAYYNTELDKEQKDFFMLQHDLAYAQNHNQLQLFLQPIVKMHDNSVYAAELLLRWNHPTRGILLPNEFIPLTIKAGLLSKITWWIIESTCRQIKAWKISGRWKLNYISININPQQLLETNFANKLMEMLRTYNIEKNEIVLEITERTLIDNFENTQDIINQLKAYGIRCAIDDFGIGYSSLSYLKRLSLDILKIDREFVKDIDRKPKELLLMKSILEIGRQFHYTIIVEGIEKDTQIEALTNIDNDLYYQGYIYSKAIDMKMFEERFLQ